MKGKVVLIILFVVGFVIGFAITTHLKGDEETTKHSKRCEEMTNLNGFVEFISSSYSQRQFTSKPISDEIIQKILVAGHRAGSARNAQPWHFTVVRNRELIDEIMNNVTDENVLIVVSGPREDPNSRFSMNFDCALATQNMFLAAQALGLGARMYAIPVQNINENLLPKLGLPDENLRVKIVLRIGYEAEDVDATTAASPRLPLENKVNFIVN